MRQDGARTKRELLEELKITDRRLKFWVTFYKLPVNRRGRGSTYPRESVEALRLITRLSESGLFTMKFVDELLKARAHGAGADLAELLRASAQFAKLGGVGFVAERGARPGASRMGADLL